MSALSRQSPVAGSAPGDKGLKTGAIGFAAGVVIGVASTAPGYSLAASLGLVVAVVGIGVYAPVIMIVSFIPMVLIAASYYWMNRADPDCGTTFSWATRAMGPYAGWIGGWAIIVADIIVMANLAQISGLYLFLLLGISAPSTFAVTAVGVAFIAAMTWICVIGIELNAKTQTGLLAAELVTLAIFAVVALVRVYSGDALAGSIEPSAGWFNPANIGSVGALTSGVLLAVFIYWGWDSTVSVNEETEDPTETPGRAAVLSTVILVLIYVLVTVAAVSFGGPELLTKEAGSGDVLGLLANDVFGSDLLGKLVIIAVLTSAAASCQTTILPTARTALSMARAKALPAKLGEVSPQYMTPTFATWLMGALSIIWYVGLTLVSENLLFDAIASLGLMIAFYYALTGYACVIYYRNELFKSVRNFLLIGVAPLLGAVILTAIFIKSCVDMWDPANSESGTAWLGIGPPLVIGLGSLAMGVVLVVLWRLGGHPEFFGRRLETADPGLL